MKLTNRHGLPDVLVRAVQADPYSSGPSSDISVTTLIQPPRVVALERRYADQITEDVADRIPAFLGTLGHSLLERAATDDECDVIEERFYIKVEGVKEEWQVSGQVDLIYEDVPNFRTILDAKFISVWKRVYGERDGYPEYTKQLNLYRLLAEAAGYKIGALKVLAIYRDWSRAEASKNGALPQQQAEMIDIELWDRAKARAFLQEQVDLHQLAQSSSDEDMVMCTQDERWERSGHISVIKEGNKRATLRAKNMDEVHAFMQGLDPQKQLDYHVIEVPGDPIRCKSWCSVNKFCSWYVSYKKSQKEEKANADAFFGEKQQPPQGATHGTGK